MVKNQDESSRLIEKWLSTKSTVEFLGVWEILNNPDFNSPEFEGFKSDAGSNKFTRSVKKWITSTRAIGISAKSGRHGGTYAHKDIAFEFGTWISPEFKLLLIKEFQRLKDDEQKRLSSGWDYKRFLSKVNYRLHTDAIKENIILKIKGLTKEQANYIYADEAEMLNMALFGETSKEWRKGNPEMVIKGLNIRDLADAHELIVLSNIEYHNSLLLKDGLSPKERLMRLTEAANTQLTALSKTINITGSIESPYVISKTAPSSFDKTLQAVLSVPKPKE